jgi:hypothetical protein
MPHVRSKKLSGWRGLPARLIVAYLNIPVAVLGRHGGTVYGSEANAPTFGARTQSLVVACRAAESLRAAMAWVANTVAAISAADTKVILVICFSIWWQKPRKRSAPCCEERPALGEISSRSFNKAGAWAVTSGDGGGHGHRNFRTLPESGEGLSQSGGCAEG